MEYKNKSLSCVQQVALELIISDAKFITTLADINKNAKNIASNYMLMTQPYIGVFADGAEQWCQKVGLDSPRFTAKEKIYYQKLRLSHKLLDKSYADYCLEISETLKESDEYFRSIRRLREKILGYYNIGADIINNEYCGNTILCAMYSPVNLFKNQNAGEQLRDMAIIAGKIAGFLGCTLNTIYEYKSDMKVGYDDFHFYKDTPLKINNELGLVLFSIICTINYTIQFIENYFTDEIPQKFKYAYLQYYYLCDFIEDLNDKNNTNFYLNTTLKHTEFRNCLAHYGLGQFVTEKDIVEADPLKGLTQKAFGLNYFEAKEKLYCYLRDLVFEIKEYTLK